MPAAHAEFPMGGESPQRSQPPVRSQPPTRSQAPGRSQPPTQAARGDEASHERSRSVSQPSGSYAVATPSDNPRAFRSDPLSSLPPNATDREVRREQAETLWRRAEAMAKRSEHDAGLQTAREAMRLGYSRPEHDALLGWLIFQHGGGDPSVMPHVWKCLDRALKRDSLCEQALYYKALVLNLTGQAEQARVHLQRVLMLNPDHAEAAHELRIYELRRAHEQQQSGFLRRLLGGK
jgi:hypothetical protein